jgi:linoleoyl-CoA desaturase
MKAKHIKNPEHTLLYKSLLKEIKNSIKFDPNKVRKYFTRKALFYVSISLLSYSLFFVLKNPLMFLLNYMVFGMLAVMLCFNFAHDLSHNALLKKPKWNNFFFEMIYTMVGAHPSAWKARHLHSHHFAPNVKHFDTDLAITGLIRVIPDSERKWYHRFQHIYAPIAYMSYSLYWVCLKDFLVLRQFAPKTKSKRPAYYTLFTGLKMLYFLYLIVLPLVFGHQSVGIVLLAFLLMHLSQSLYTLFTFFITHHVSDSLYPNSDEKGIIDTTWFMNQVKSSNDFYPFSRWANFVFGGVNNHIAHHLFPTIIHYYYPE